MLVSSAASRRSSPFAYLKDRTWFERGEMGYFTMVSNEKDQKSWDAEFEAFWASLDPEAIVTIVDCHI